MIEPYVYPPMDREERVRRLEEHYATLACRDGMEEIIRHGFDGAHLDSNCARKAIEEFSLQRVELVLAATIQRRSWDGRFSQRVREWADACDIPPGELNRGYTLNAHSVMPCFSIFCPTSAMPLFLVGTRLGCLRSSMFFCLTP